MLLTKEVVVKWYFKSKDWYISKGYNFTKPKETFKVNVEDLMDNSKVRIDVRCDFCNKKIENIKWSSYIKNLNTNNKKYKCLSCSRMDNSKITQNAILKSMSFKEWCVKNKKHKILDLWDYDLNETTPNLITYKTNRKYYFKCARQLHKSELKTIKTITNSEGRSLICKHCNSFAQWGIDNICIDFLQKYWDYDKNTISPWEVSLASTNKVFIKCQNKSYHPSYKIGCGSFSNPKKPQRCSYCSSKKICCEDSLKQHITLHFGEEFFNNIWSDKNKKNPSEIHPSSHKKVWWKCTKGIHKDYERSVKNSKDSEYRCPICSKEEKESIYQMKVRKYIDALGYEVLNEYNCNITPINPKTKMPLPLDNEIECLKLIIEVHGSQHYEIDGGWVKNNESLHKRKLIDRYKRMYVKSKGYHYLEISYLDVYEDKHGRKPIDIYKEKIDNKIKEILEKEVDNFEEI